MANLLRNCEDFAVPYLDDIAIFSLAWDDPLKHLKDVFDHLRSSKLHIKPSKCQFAQACAKHLGHLVGQGLRTPGELKVQVIKDFPIPTNKTQYLTMVKVTPSTPHVCGSPNYSFADVDSLYVVIDPKGVDMDYFGNHCTKPKKFTISVATLTDSAPTRLK
ncbi:reverse transcriptase domain-containing protein [Trichonephila clavipes]|nr:reverse transcriptase domain-containing protein [Trichonephila clavipes]